MLGVEIEFGNHWILTDTSSYRPTKVKTPEAGVFSVSDGGPGRNRPGLEGV